MKAWGVGAPLLCALKAGGVDVFFFFCIIRILLIDPARVKLIDRRSCSGVWAYTDLNRKTKPVKYEERAS